MSDEKKWRTEVPNIIDDLGLDPYERTLYVHYKRVCGADSGQCTEGVRGTADKTKISRSKVASVRTQLVERGLIQIQPFGEVGGVAVTIVDIWPLNHTYYATKDRPAIAGWTIEELTRWVKGVHHKDTPPPIKEDEPEESPPDRQGCPPQGQGCPPDGHKKEPLKNLTPNGVGGNIPPGNPTEQENGIGPRKQLMNEFLTCSGLKLPYRKKDQGFWWSSIGEIYELFDRDIDIGKKMIRQTIDELRRDKMRVSGPESLIKTARDLSAQKNYKPRISIK